MDAGFAHSGVIGPGTTQHGCKTNPNMTPGIDPAAVVQRQLDAFNARDLDALLSVYAADAQMFEHPAKLVASGTAEFRERFMVRFQERNLRADLLSRMVMGSMVVDHERVTRMFPEGPGTVELIMLYEVRDGGIVRAWSIAGTKRLEKAP